MDYIQIYWGSDSIFEKATSRISEPTYLQDVLNHIGRTEITIAGLRKDCDDVKPMKIDNLLVFTDDYGALREWALLGFTKNVLENLKVEIKNLWLNNPPQTIYEDIIRNNPKEIIQEHHRTFTELSDESLQKMVTTYAEYVVGQDHVMKNIVTSLYSLKQKDRKRPVTLLFLGDSGVGKTETAKFVGACMGQEMVRVQFSMQQTAHAYQFIFGADHGENSLARELIRRKSNVILMDEFDKVSPAFYNAFYQMFDEGLFVDANYSVDVSRSIIICTTNYLSIEDAEKHLGAPVFSRFSKIIKFNPISIDDRIKIAQRCIDETIARLPEEDSLLLEKARIVKDFSCFIQQGNYSNMRMLKNDVEEAVNYHILKAKSIIV